MAGLTSLPRKKNIKGQPHKLAYVTEAEGDLLKCKPWPDSVQETVATCLRLQSHPEIPLKTARGHPRP